MIVTVNPLEVSTRQEFGDLADRVSALFESYKFRHDITVKYEDHEGNIETIMEFYVDVDVDDYGRAQTMPNWHKNDEFYKSLPYGDFPDDEDLPF